MRSRSAKRDGLSLLEVLIALATFVMSISGIVFLMGVANNAAIEAQMRSQAISIAQSRLAEVSAGVMPVQGQGMTACEDDADYEWSMDVDSGAYNGLSNVTLRVRRKRANGTYLECFLSQMVFDPSQVGTVFDSAQDPDTTTAPDSAGGSGSGSSAGSPSAGAAAAPKSGPPAAPASKSPPSGGSAPKVSGGSAPKSSGGAPQGSSPPASAPKSSSSPGPRSTGSRTGG